MVKVSALLNPRIEAKRPRFPPGQIVATPAALLAFERTSENMAAYLNRHSHGDWGDVDEQDRAENEYSLQHGLRLLSAYRLMDGTRVWIITESDRSVTTVLLPSDY